MEAQTDRSQFKDWNIIYPAYLNSEFTERQGRRVPKEKAVRHPRLDEISMILKHFKLNHVVEMDKSYPREWWNNGRIRFQLKQADGSLTNPEISSKKKLLVQMAELIPKLKTRQEDATVGTGATTSTSGGAAKKNKNKKNKKRK
eukprot:CAMPEP_0115024354 /NCGR_PEP_ID=MMETSP0216-20121206/33146_1 /TAXON_ID=223996 /ORGANISM="Protocruzia adherens, Strain Boccale" /LENGTH=143 /DNA_ID=CAMNT_0002398313 /DNA_START=33 /DNA_END=464 /DNA_ORIENTATION=-